MSKETLDVVIKIFILVVCWIALIQGLFRFLFIDVFRVGQRIVVTLTPDVITFDSGKKQVSLKTFLYLKMTQPTMVISIGEEINAIEYDGTGEDLVRVELFAPESYLPSYAPSVDKSLMAFIDHGFNRVSEPASVILAHFFKPRVMIRGINTLQPILNGYQKFVFDAVLAGRVSVIQYEDV